ncbi:MAG: SpoIID/LytB domain-containing protein [Thermoleophilia bacterium]|nr:SpoIID/LytB domain-containing protein [Thermoleophilia bacterium]
MRRLLILAAVLAAAVAVPGPAAGTTFVFTGQGWGHGVGLAQYGALGFAEHGWTHEQILAHYYPGTELARTGKARIRVLLASGRQSLELGSEAPFRVTDANGTLELPAGTYTIGAGLTLATGGQARQLVSPVRFSPGPRPLRLGRPYGGAIVVTVADGGLMAVNDVGLEKYVRGVIAREMPAEWHAEALAAQAIAARTYALASREQDGAFDVYADTRSQVYGGIEAEHPRTNAAVAATRRTVVRYQGKIAWTFFSASSGGRTAAIEDAWAGSEPVPYLVAVEDPYDAETSPFHTWGPVGFTESELRAKLGSKLPDGLTGLAVELNASGRVASVIATGAGGTTEIPGSTMRTALGLRSTWFAIEAQGALSASAQRVVFGQKVKLTANLGNTARAVVEARPAGEAWSALRDVDATAHGRIAVTVKPAVTTVYRLRLASGRGEPVTVRVEPRVTLSAGRRAFTGSVEPAVGGAIVTIQERGADAWRDVAAGEVGTDGRFAVRVRPGPGTYRARVAATAGLAAGTSAAETVGPA